MLLYWDYKIHISIYMYEHTFLCVWTEMSVHHINKHIQNTKNNVYSLHWLRFLGETPAHPVPAFIHLDQPDQLVWANKSSELFFSTSVAYYLTK